MGTTANFDLPYPSLGDAANVPQRIQELAEATDAALGGSFISYSPAVGGTSSPTVLAKYAVVGELVTVHFLITITAAVTTTLTMDLPTTPHADVASTQSLGTVMMRDTSAGGANRQFGFAGLSGASSVLFYYNATAATTSFITSGVYPWTWASTDTIGGTVTYRSA